jgi:hypothetical protein
MINYLTSDLRHIIFRQSKVSLLCQVDTKIFLILVSMSKQKGKKMRFFFRKMAAQEYRAEIYQFSSGWTSLLDVHLLLVTFNSRFLMQYSLQIL